MLSLDKFIVSFRARIRTTMRIAAYLMVSLMAVQISSATFRRHKPNKSKGPFGGYLADFGHAAFDGILRYAPDFYDVGTKLAFKLLSGGNKKKHRYDNYDEDYPVAGHHNKGKPISLKRWMRLLHRIPQPHVHPVLVPLNPSVLAHHGNGYAGAGYGSNYGGYSHYPLSIPHGSFDELPVHGTFHDPIDFSNSLHHFNDFSTSSHHFGAFYDHDHLDYL